MRPNELPVAVKNSGVALEDLVPVLLRSPPHRRGYLRVAQLYRRLAVGTLLLSADTRRFCDYLFKAGRAFADFCARADSGDLLGSAFTPVLDAIVCRDEQGVKALAARMPSGPNPAKEYEEDFYYIRILAGLYVERKETPQIRQWFDAYELIVASSKREDFRLDVCRAFLAGVQKDLEDALLDAAERVQREAKRRYDEERWEMDEGNLFTRLSIEVLAWIEIGGRLGLAVTGALPMAPAVARPTATGPFPPPESWRTPERFKSL